MKKKKVVGKWPFCLASVTYTNEASSSGIWATVTESLRCHLTRGHKGRHVDTLMVTEYKPERKFRVPVYWPNEKRRGR